MQTIVFHAVEVMEFIITLTVRLSLKSMIEVKNGNHLILEHSFQNFRKKPFISVHLASPLN
jgi:hypothetical protein